MDKRSNALVIKMLDSRSRGPYSFFFLIVHKYDNTRCNLTPLTYSNYEGIVALQIILLHNNLTKRELEGWLCLLHSC